MIYLLFKKDCLTLCEMAKFYKSKELKAEMYFKLKTLLKRAEYLVVYKHINRKCVYQLLYNLPLNRYISVEIQKFSINLGQSQKHLLILTIHKQNDKHDTVDTVLHHRAKLLHQ